LQACGSIAAIHAIANNAKTLNLPKESILGKFIEESKGLANERICLCILTFLFNKQQVNRLLKLENYWQHINQF
jgi:hypothetical protein